MKDARRKAQGAGCVREEERMSRERPNAETGI